ncbi:MAG: transposase [Planctomycetes bacterium]|nr:transposase [Planctomycetota bacterium]
MAGADAGALAEKRLTCLAVEQGVLAIPVPARGNSTTCPQCHHRSRKNRQGCLFSCVQCGHQGDADHVGALAAKRHGEALLDQALVARRHEREEEQRKRERRAEAAKRRGQATKEKWQQRREAAAREEVKTDTPRDGAQVPAARAPSGHAPFRNPTRGGAPDENPEAGDPLDRRQAAGRRGEEPIAWAPPRPRGQLPSSRVSALGAFSDKP